MAQKEFSFRLDDSGDLNGIWDDGEGESGMILVRIIVKIIMN